MRREFIKNSLVVAVAGSIAPALFAQADGPQEGKHYRRLNNALPTDDPKKIEVIEFFWYGCPHCASIDPLVVDWSKKLGPDVAFRKEHVAFPQAIKHQQLFYTLKALGVESQVGPTVFDSIHKDRRPLLQVNDMAELAAKAGVDRKKFTETFESFSVKTRMRSSASLSDKFGVDGVPAFGVNGKYYTAAAMAGGNGQVIAAIDALIVKERAGRKA